MTQNLEISAQVAAQSLGLTGAIAANASYHRLDCGEPGDILSCSVKADPGHAAFVATGDRAARAALVAAFDAAYPAGLTIETAFGPVTGSLGADPHGNRFVIGRWSFSANGIRFADGDHVAKAVARGLLMADVARVLMPFVRRASAAPAGEALAA